MNHDFDPYTEGEVELLREAVAQAERDEAAAMQMLASVIAFCLILGLLVLAIVAGWLL